MSVLRKFMIAALVAGAATAAPATSFASTAQSATSQPGATTASTAHSVSAVPAKIRRVACRSYTFNVFSPPHRETCYEGTGTIKPGIRNVYRITTGENTGFMEIRVGPTDIYRNFLPGGILKGLPGEHIDLLLLHISRA
jgi:hypothetical protein